MLSTENYMGKITVTDSYIKALISRTVSDCFGVAEMQSSSFSEFVLNDMLKLRQDKKGIRICTKGNELIIDLHISVVFGTNIAAIVRSVKDKVEFVVSESVGAPVREINVYVDSIKE